MRIAFFEDRRAADFFPLTLLRPVFELVCGECCLRERLLSQVPTSGWGAWIRDYLVEAYQEEHPTARLNDAGWLRQEPTLLINGRWLCNGQTLQEFDSGSAGYVGEMLACVLVRPEESPLLEGSDWLAGLERIAASRQPVSVPGTILVNPWDLVLHNAQQLREDFEARRPAPLDVTSRPQLGLIGSADSVEIDETSEIEPFVTIDARRGPVSIAANTVIQSFTRIEGPCHIGAGTQVFRAHIREGTTIGPVCRVGGEVEASILHGYVNKYHEGFVGHSYICPWVNLGALTTNSDLRNDYGTVRLPMQGELVDTGARKIGCFIGDHTKTGLGCLINTGSILGTMCMVLPSGSLLPKCVPSFAMFSGGNLSPGLPLERSFAAARMMMERRGCEFTAAQQRLLEQVFDMTAGEREREMARAVARKERRAFGIAG